LQGVIIKLGNSIIVQDRLRTARHTVALEILDCDDHRQQSLHFNNFEAGLNINQPLKQNVFKVL
jgi:hypothetical protein